MYCIEGSYFGRKIKLEFETIEHIKIMFITQNMRDYIEVNQEMTMPEAYEAVFSDCINDDNRELIMGKPTDNP